MTVRIEDVRAFVSAFNANDLDDDGKITLWRDYFDMKQFGEVLAP